MEKFTNLRNPQSQWIVNDQISYVPCLGLSLSHFHWRIWCAFLNRFYFKSIWAKKIFNHLIMSQPSTLPHVKTSVILVIIWMFFWSDRKKFFFSKSDKIFLCCQVKRQKRWSTCLQKLTVLSKARLHWSTMLYFEINLRIWDKSCLQKQVTWWWNGDKTPYSS